MPQEFKDILKLLSAGEELGSERARFALEKIINGEVTSEEVSAFLLGMRAKGESIEELTAFVQVMRDAAISVDVNTEGAVDLCGTGGDNSGTFNISTAAMFVVAGAGVPVLKHGNRSISSKCGSADVLEALGIIADLGKEEIEEVYRETDMAFMFAPNFHPAMKYVMPARRALKIRTFFNLLGPLLNPADVRRQVIGAYNKEVANQMIQILSNLDTERAYTLNAHDGLDEVSLTSQTEIYELKETLSLSPVTFDPKSLGLDKVEMEALKGGDADHNAMIIRSILDGSSTTAQREMILLNAAFAINISGKAGTLEDSLKIAIESIDSGSAKKKLNRFVEATNDIKKQ